MPQRLDWDKLRVFHAVANAGSFTRASESLGLSQSAISRQISSLEGEIGAPLFHRHARGLIPTEQGELLIEAAADMSAKIDTVRSELTETRDRPEGRLRIATTVGFGSGWLTERIDAFLDEYPEIRLELVLSNEEVDIAMREADAAIRLRQPMQADLIQRRLFTVHFHVFASPDYVNLHGAPSRVADLDAHRIIGFGDTAPRYLDSLNYLRTVGRDEGDERQPVLEINSILMIRRAVERGIGIAMLPDYAVRSDMGLMRVLPDLPLPTFDTYFCYAEEMRNSAKINAFRDFLLRNARDWQY